jgi:hypothetical protein
MARKRMGTATDALEAARAAEAAIGATVGASAGPPAAAQVQTGARPADTVPATLMFRPDQLADLRMAAAVRTNAGGRKITMSDVARELFDFAKQAGALGQQT